MEGKGGFYMVAGERLALQNDLVPAVNVRAVERSHQEVEVCCQRLHDGNLGLGGAHDRGHEPGCPGIDVKPGRQRRLVERLEVPLDALRSPSRKILVDAGTGSLGLEAQGVPAEIDTLVCGIITTRRSA